MEERAVGRSGLRASSLGLGTLGWGDTTDELDARDLLKAFADAGGTLVDTAGSYGGGLAESVLGSLLGDVVDRADVVLVCGSGRGAGAGRAPQVSARTLLASLDASLARLGTDHVDVWTASAFDPTTPVEEVLRALGQAVSSGRARYAGLGGHSGWQLAGTAASAAHAGVPLVAAGTELSLLHREPEADVLPAAAHHGLGVLAFSPLGRGVLTGKYRSSVPAGSRGASEHLAAFVEPYLGAAARRVVQAVVTAADGLGAHPVEVALAWVRDVPGVTSAVVGARTAEQLQAALASDDLELPPEIRSALDEVSARATSA